MTVCMIHSVGTPCYLGCVEIDDEIAQDEPECLFETWWEEYQETSPFGFIEWLVDKHYAGATEVAYDHGSPNLPHQIYIFD